MITSPSRMRHGIFILLRRLRLPMFVLITVYSIAVLGFTLVPGLDPKGQPWTMSFLHAFYFVSFLGTTIGLGEIPYPFSDGQRLWATAAIYATVVSWLYAIGTFFSVLQDPLFRRILHENSFERKVKRIKEPFYLVCGYDDAGSRVVRELVEESIQVVVIDIEPTRADAIEVEDLAVEVPALSGDASDPASLTKAGLAHPLCAGVLALTGDDTVNIKIALTARLLNPALKVLCAARDHASHARMAAVHVEQIINPFDTFAERVALSIRTPSLHVIYESLTTQRGTAMDEPQQLPHGRWILCGFGLFARTLRRQLERLDIQVVIIDRELDDSCDDTNSFVGDPTDPAVMRRAGAEDADVLIAGTSTDIDNLTIVLAAHAINKGLLIVARQTQRRNSAVFRASPANLVMLSGYVIAGEVLREIRAPQLTTFLRRARDEDETWAHALLQSMRDTIGDEVVESWSVEIDAIQTPTVCRALANADTVTLGQLMIVADGQDELIHAVPLFMQRGNECSNERGILRPRISEPLQLGDRVLFCGTAWARSTMRKNLVTHTLLKRPML